jgi:hypothetical protein
LRVGNTRREKLFRLSLNALGKLSASKARSLESSPNERQPF